MTDPIITHQEHCLNWHMGRDTPSGYLVPFQLLGFFEVTQQCLTASFLLVDKMPFQSHSHGRLAEIKAIKPTEYT